MARIIIALVFFIPSILSAATLSMNTGHVAPRSTVDGKGFEDLIVKEAFRRVGQEIRIIHAPSERCLVNANNGADDGNFARIAGLESIYPNLIRVPESIAIFEFAVFSKKNNISVNGWSSLSPYKTGIITGWKILEKNLGNIPSLYRATDQESLFAMLEQNHIEVAVFELTEGKEILKKNKKTAIKPAKQLLDKRDMYIYMNKRHSALIEPLSNALKDMKQDGTFQKIISTFK